MESTPKSQSIKSGRALALVCVVLALVLVPGRSGSTQSAFPLRDGDTWVMVGDSITAQRLHTNYIEAFCFTRFPRWTFRFRNSGVGGDRIPTALERWSWDVGRWRPTVVSVELGMNDSGAGPGSAGAYRAGMVGMLEQIRQLAARPVWISPSPVNDGSSPAQWKSTPSLRNATLDSYSTALGEAAREHKVPYADQFHLLAPVWARNTALLNLLNAAQSLAGSPDVPGGDQLQAWVKGFQASGVEMPVSLGGDAVHPGPPGQLTMAAAILSQLLAPGLVSQVTIDSTGGGRVVEPKQCAVTNLKVAGAVVSFTRKDDCLPFPIADDARPAAEMTPLVRGLNQFMLSVKGLKDGSYSLKMDDVPVASLTSAQMSQGFNLGMLDRGPISDQCRAVLVAVRDKETLVAQWRSTSRQSAGSPSAEAEVRLAEIDRQVREADERIRVAAQPKAHRYTIELIK